MEALIKVTVDELKQDLLDKIKQLVKGTDSAEIIIQVKNNSSSSGERSNSDYWQELKNSIAEKEAGQTTTFTMEEFRTYVDENFS